MANYVRNLRKGWEVYQILNFSRRHVSYITEYVLKQGKNFVGLIRAAIDVLRVIYWYD